jgi:hypothetical protein
MPAFAVDYFGAENVGSIYGLMLTAWGSAGVLGPTRIARIRQSSGHYTQALHVTSIIVLVSAVIPLITRPPEAEAVEAKRRLRAAWRFCISGREIQEIAPGGARHSI